MENIAIEKDIPIPAARINPECFAAMLRKLEIGDSFVTTRESSNIHSSALGIGIKITTRKQSDGTRRVWRTA